MHNGLQSSATDDCGLIIWHIGWFDGKARFWGDHHNSSWVVWGPVGRVRVTVEPAREIGAWRLRGGRARFRRARTILDHSQGRTSLPGATVEAVAGPSPPPLEPTLLAHLPPPARAYNRPINIRSAGTYRAPDSFLRQ
jgi:hypothetical protein